MKKYYSAEIGIQFAIIDSFFYNPSKSTDVPIHAIKHTGGEEV
jgi:hypothetical protein